MKKTKLALLQSVISLLLCVSMLMGTTFAWFTDSVTSENNIIVSGTLKVGLDWKEAPDGAWKDASEGAIFDYSYWEPGYTQVRYVRITNKGNLAFRYRLNILPAVTPAQGEVNLADVIDVYLFAAGADVSRDAIAAATPVGTLSQLMADPDGAAYGRLLATDAPVECCIVLKMQETAGNEYQNLSVGGGFKVTLLATQETYEKDSFGSDYDFNANYPYVPGPTVVAENVTAAAKVENGAVSEEVTIKGTASSAVIPEGVKMAEDADKLTFTLTPMDITNADVETTSRDEVLRSVDIHVDGVAEDNTVPMTFVLTGLFPKGLNSNNVKLYHVEGDETKEMTLVDTPVNHNEFSYDPLTGDAVVTIASFSELAAYADTNAGWDGKTVDYTWYDEDEAELTIANASQFVAFRNIVDGVKINGVHTIDDFKGQKITLEADINLNGHNFDPIGWGYDNAAWNATGVTGEVFKGHFDGGSYTIYGLYQNGWDLESATGTDYTYTNCGFGLFAAASGATFQNLTISGATITVECVEAGILVGLSQGNCTYDNIKIYNSKIANYQRPAGGLIGEVSGTGTTKISNVDIGSDVVVGTLWGDFDAPVGGVIGAYWDDAGTKPGVEMTNVNVAARLDVYNDVTSTYEWYAYRRAGMLIGNTDTPVADGKHSATAEADFLECTNVVVYYGDWVNYHYCQFTTCNESWPWVRVEEGENCAAYSNPRWGVATIDGKPVTDAHTEEDHIDGEGHNVELKFNQLYGGGQGVYGATSHPGVTEGVYTITYINNGKVLDVKYVEDNSVAVSTANTDAQKKAMEGHDASNITFKAWINAGSTVVSSVDVGNTQDIILYPSYNKLYTAMFVDQQGNILDYMMFTTEQKIELQEKANATEALVPVLDGFEFDYWAVQIKNSDGTYTTRSYKDYTSASNLPAKDITIYPVYKYNGDVSLIPVDENGDGSTDYYQVGGYGANTGEQELVEIPGEVNGVAVTTINANAFSSYDDLHSVRIPGTIEVINSQSFTADNPNQWGTQRDTVTLYYEGDPAVWNEAMEKYNAKDYSGILKQNWDNNMGESSCVFFLDENGKVDLNKGYWELANVKDQDSFLGLGTKFTWQYHNHPYGTNSGCSNEHNNKTNYAGTCDCDSCNGAIRPDAQYWN